MALFTFIDVEGVEPTNNFAERSLRSYVIWRKISFGTQSENGNRFVERMSTVSLSCQLQNRNGFHPKLEKKVNNYVFGSVPH